jgi:PAS domain-containing protein
MPAWAAVISWRPTFAGRTWGDAMGGLLPLPRIMLLLGAALGVVVVLVLVLYALMKLARRQVRGGDTTPAPRRVTDDMAFMSSALQDVIKDLKSKEKELTESLRAAERRVEEQAHILENLGALLPVAFCVINREGLITLWNPLLRSLLKVDVWSRRHFEDVFGPDSQLAGLLRDCLTNGRTCQDEKVEYAVAAGETKTLCVSAMPWHTQHGEIGGIVCLLTELDPGSSHCGTEPRPAVT